MDVDEWRCGLDPGDEERADKIARCNQTEEDGDRGVCHEYAEENGFQYVDEGTARVIYELPGNQIFGGEDCVLKVAKHKGGRIQNENEEEAYEDIVPKRSMLAAVREVDEDHEWLVMSQAGDQATEEEVKDWQEDMWSSGFMCRDRKVENFGKRGSSVKMVDYGDGCSVR